MVPPPEGSHVRNFSIGETTRRACNEQAVDEAHLVDAKCAGMNEHVRDRPRDRVRYPSDVAGSQTARGRTREAPNSVEAEAAPSLGSAMVGLCRLAEIALSE